MPVFQRDCNDVIIPWEDAPEGYDYWVVSLEEEDDRERTPSAFHRLGESSNKYIDEDGKWWCGSDNSIKVYKRPVDSKPSEKESVSASKGSDTTLQDMTITLSEPITVTVSGTYEVFSPMVDEVVEFKDVNLLKAYVEEYKIIMKLLGKEV